MLFVAAWIGLNLGAAAAGFAPLDPPPFPRLEGLLTLTALLVTTVVLIGQTRQSRLAQQRAHLDLQINLLTEQKVTTLIHLIEGLRAGSPQSAQALDTQVSQLKKPTDATQVAAALKQRETSGGGPQSDKQSGG